MKTLKYLSIALTATLALVACGGGSDDPDDPYTPQPQPPTPSEQGLFLSMTCDMPAEASEKTVALTGLNSRITKQSQAVATPWLTVAQLPYSSGTPSVTVACTANLEASRRVMDVVFLANNNKDTLLFTVRQAAYSGGSSGGTNVDTPNDTPTDQPAYSRGQE